jgi:hypothetical protein
MRVVYMRFRPADLLANPREFGRATEPTGWKTADIYRPEFVAAARLQHVAAWEVRDALGIHADEPEPLRRNRLQKSGATVCSLEELAAAMGETPLTLMRKLNGQAAASLSDLAGWAYHLNWPTVWAAVQDRTDLMRPGDSPTKKPGRPQAGR